MGPVVTNSAVLEAALTFASRKWPVLPVARNKAPLTRHGYKDATTDPTNIRDYWDKWPDANLGVVTGGSSGIVVIDIDGPDGEDSLKALEGIYGPLPPTLEARTGRGRHLFYKINLLRCPSGKLGLGIDFKADGGFVVVPPSMHDSGQLYRWINECEPVELPAWVVRQTVRSLGADNRVMAAQWRGALLCLAYVATVVLSGALPVQPVLGWPAALSFGSIALAYSFLSSTITRVLDRQSAGGVQVSGASGQTRSGLRGAIWFTPSRVGSTAA